MKQSRSLFAIAALLAMFIIALLGNVFLTLHYLNWGAGPKADFFIAIGLLVSQPCLLSIWCALGGQTTILRIPASMGMLAALTIAYSAVLNNDGAPAEVMLVIGGIVIAITLIVQIPLWVFRVKTKQVIVLPIATETQPGTSQFGIKHLLIATTIAAIIVAIAQAFCPPIDELEGGGGPWIPVILFVTFFVLLTSAISFLMLSTIFSQRHRIAFLLILMVFLMTCPLGAAWMVSQFSGLFFPPQGMSLTIVGNTYGFIWGFALGIAIVILIFYALGFRMQRVSHRQPIKT